MSVVPAVTVSALIMPYHVRRARRCRCSTENKSLAPSVKVGGVQPFLSNHICLLEGVLYSSDLAAHELAQSLLGGYVLTNCRQDRGGHGRARAEAYSNQGLRSSL